MYLAKESQRHISLQEPKTQSVDTAIFLPGQQRDDHAHSKRSDKTLEEKRRICVLNIRKSYRTKQGEKELRQRALLNSSHRVDRRRGMPCIGETELNG